MDKKLFVCNASSAGSRSRAIVDPSRTPRTSTGDQHIRWTNGVARNFLSRTADERRIRRTCTARCWRHRRRRDRVSISATTTRLVLRSTPTVGAGARSPALGKDVVVHHPQRASAATARSSRHRPNPTSSTPPPTPVAGSGGASSSIPPVGAPSRRASHRSGGRLSRHATPGGRRCRRPSLVLVDRRRRAAGGDRGDSSHWTERAQALLAPLLHAAALEGADMRTVLTWVDRRQALPAHQILAGPGGGDHRASPATCLDGIVSHRRTGVERHLVDRFGRPGRLPLRGGPGRHRPTRTSTRDLRALGRHPLHRRPRPPPGAGRPPGGRG